MTTAENREQRQKHYESIKIVLKTLWDFFFFFTIRLFISQSNKLSTLKNLYKLIEKLLNNDYEKEEYVYSSKLF